MKVRISKQPFCDLSFTVVLHFLAESMVCERRMPQEFIMLFTFLAFVNVVSIELHRRLARTLHWTDTYQGHATAVDIEYCAWHEV